MGPPPWIKARQLKVVRVKARGQRELVTLVGYAAAISAGEWITAAGHWVNDRTPSRGA